MTREVITVKGREIAYEIADVDILGVKFYRDNPRINYIISKYPSEQVTQELIEEKLLELDSTKELMKDLEENKGLLDEVYVLGNKVVEGNRRLCAYRRLYKKTADARWRRIKARVLKGSVSEDELFFILGTFHVKGKQPWDAYEKASYIYRTIKVLGKSPEEISRELGYQKKTIEAMMKAYETMSQRYLPSSGPSELVGESKDELKKYSYFEALFRQKELVKRVEDTPSFVDDFIDWVRSERLKKAQDVRELSKILGNKKACKTFCEEDGDSAFKKAMAVLYYHKPEKVDKFYRRIREFREMIGKVEPVKLRGEINKNKSKRDELQRCYKDLKRFCKEVGVDIK